MSYIVKGYPLSDINLAPESEVEEVLQNVAALLATYQQSVPMGRDIGIRGEFVDKPMPAAEAILVAEVNDAIPLWEPRATVVSASIEYDSDNPGKMIPVVEVEINGE